MAVYLHRFLRLRQTLGWSLIEMDQAVMALDDKAKAGEAPALDAAFLIKLAHLVEMKERLGVELVELLSWWSNIDTADYTVEGIPPRDSFYEQLSPAVHMDDPRTKAFSLNSARTELKNPPAERQSYVDLIAGIVGLSPADLCLLEADLALTDAKLNLSTLSCLYRHTSLARALDLDISNYLLAKKLMGFDPFMAPSEWSATFQTLRFQSRVHAIKQSDFSFDELHYLTSKLKRKDGATLAPAEQWITETIGLLKQTLAQIEAPAEATVTVGDNRAVSGSDATALIRNKALAIAL